jgi:GT2 family glycosyltransferase
VELTEACVASIRRTDSQTWPIVVVDDGSNKADDFRRFGGVRLLRHARPLGVTAAWNTGACVVETPFIVWLNNDVIAFGPWIDRLLAPLRAGTAAIAGAAWRTEREVDFEWLRRSGGDRFPQGWCFATSRRTWRELDGFDESMAVYFSDTDFFLRARQRGLRLEVIERLPLKHLGHRTAHDPACLRDRCDRWQRDRQTFLAKHSSLRAGSASDPAA